MCVGRLHDRLLYVENSIHLRLVAHSVGVLRVAVGAVFLGFGVLKFFPGVSPAENLTKATTDLLTFGLVPGGVSIVAVATLECFIGASLIAGRFMRLALWLLALEFVGILSPLVLLPGRLFSGPHHAPTLEGQYVLKDVILVGAAMVIAAATFRGGRLIRSDAPPGARGMACSHSPGSAGQRGEEPGEVEREAGQQRRREAIGARELEGDVVGQGVR